MVQEKGDFGQIWQVFQFQQPYVSTEIVICALPTSQGGCENQMRKEIKFIHQTKFISTL